MKQESLKKYIRKLVQEAIQAQKTKTIKESPNYGEDEAAEYFAMLDDAENDLRNPDEDNWDSTDYDNHEDIPLDTNRAGMEIEKMTIGQLKQQGYTPEEILKLTSEGKTVNKNKKVFVVKESKKQLDNKQYVKILENRKALIESMISEKGLMSKLGSMFGKVNPSLDVDNEDKASKVIDGSILKAKKLAKNFQNKSLNTTSAINSFHDAVLDALDKWASLSDTVPEKKEALEKQVVGLARVFFQSLNAEKGRIESYLKTITNDMAAKGFDKSMMTAKLKDGESEDGSRFRNKEDVIPMKSIGSAVKDMATSWVK